MRIVLSITFNKGIRKISLLVNRIRPNMIKSEDMMSIEDVKNILGIPLIGAIPDNEQVIIASKRGEPIVLDEKLTPSGIAFENTALRLVCEEVEFLNFNGSTLKNPVKRFLGNLLNRSK